jgi:hypothetical protein
MKKHDTIITAKINTAFKARLKAEASRRHMSLSQLIRMKLANFQSYDGEDISVIGLRVGEHLILQRCARCNGIFINGRIGAVYCDNNCGCNKPPCNCGAEERQRLLID